MLRNFLNRKYFIYFFTIHHFLFAQQHLQDSIWVLNNAHKTLQVLCSKSHFGRGYTRNGLQHSQKFLLQKLKLGLPLFNAWYIQDFTHPVNTFPQHSLYILNGKNYSTGYDLLPDPSTASLHGAFQLHWFQNGKWKDSTNNVQLEYKRKLTHSVSTHSALPFKFYTNDSTLIEKTSINFKINHNAQFISHFKNKNLGCYVKGSIYPDSFIVISAHYDHLGGIGKKIFYPGANDNASGVSMLLNLLYYFSNHPHQKSIAFVLFSAEEAGLLGSHFFTEHPPMALSQINTLINLDLLGTGEEGMMVVNGSVYPELFNTLLKCSEPYKHLSSKLKKRGKAANSDHYWFTEKGVKSVFLYTMGGISAYHDPYDKPETLPLTAYYEIFRMLRDVIESL
jgi:aminopeptidase YwaD